MIKYVEKNLNFKNKKTGDCVIRAFAMASGKDYKVVAKELFDIWMETGYVLNEKRCEDKWLERNGWLKVKQPKKEDNTKYLVGEIDELINENQNCIIRLAHHITCVVDNNLIDIWDCRYKTIGNYYIKKVVR